MKIYKNKSLLLAGALVLVFLFAGFTKTHAATVSCDMSQFGNFCGQNNCNDTYTVSETSSSYLVSAWMGGNVSWDDWVSWSLQYYSGTGNFTVFTKSNTDPNPPPACGTGGASSGI